LPSMSSVAAERIRVRGLRKSFSTGAVKMTAFRLLGSLLARNGRDHGHERRVIAIDALSVRSGEVVGLIGENGAGKTTLLKLLAGLYAPNSGSIERNGSLVYFAGLGVGMIQDLSVRENIYLYGAICGIARARLDVQFDGMLQWAELSDFVDARLRTLSAGMKTRLAFAIASCVDADVLLLDEAFSAGDRRFQNRCNDFIVARRGGPTATLIATHNLSFVQQFCTRAVWLDHGKLRAEGDPTRVVESYQEYCNR
jgi:ABC-type polysaccharide/polyol phosphate transport system ATPase subunit